jgi:hypothetical protein
VYDVPSTYAVMVNVAFSPNVIGELVSDPRMPSSQPMQRVSRLTAIESVHGKYVITHLE